MSTIRGTLFVGVVILIMLACDLPVRVPTADPAVAQTLAALTVAAMQPPPTLTPLPPAR